MKYQLADLVNGNYGEVFESYEQAEKALVFDVAEGNEMNLDVYGEGHQRAEDFIFIVEV